MARIRGRVISFGLSPPEVIGMPPPFLVPQTVIGKTDFRAREACTLGGVSATPLKYCTSNPIDADEEITVL
ncbi:hypothetical protein [Roseobacter sp.]|uniref:hypothetical protein n=1 Tax=Roseobacter sp. TaxID=1907202 RepID=UPI002966354E|nr:hypothetical protein [Roseobacter sp.]MDW3182170.1 hypothetical protein [Roseobacter sp.]